MLSSLIPAAFAAVLAVAGLAATMLCLQAKDRLGKAAGLGAAGGVLLAISQLAQAGWQFFLPSLFSSLGPDSSGRMAMLTGVSILLGVLHLAAVLLLIFALLAARNAPGAGAAAQPTPGYGPAQPGYGAPQPGPGQQHPGPYGQQPGQYGQQPGAYGQQGPGPYPGQPGHSGPQQPYPGNPGPGQQPPQF